MTTQRGVYEHRGHYVPYKRSCGRILCTVGCASPLGGAMNYPFRTDEQQASLDRLPATKYSEDDTPFLATQRYSLSPDYEPSDVVAKQQVDTQGSLDMQYSMAVWKASQA